MATITAAIFCASTTPSTTTPRWRTRMLTRPAPRIITSMAIAITPAAEGDRCQSRLAGEPCRLDLYRSYLRRGFTSDEFGMNVPLGARIRVPADDAEQLLSLRQADLRRDARQRVDCAVFGHSRGR